MNIFPAPSVPTPVGPYSQAVRLSNLLFTAGQLPINPVTGKIDNAHDVLEQAHQVFDNLESLLGDNGLTMQNVAKCTLYLIDMADFIAINTIFEEHFSGHKPARSTIQAGRLPIGARVMVDAVAEIPAS
jgi:2-iminobutanoate/2-iminopropanoate deaminase